MCANNPHPLWSLTVHIIRRTLLQYRTDALSLWSELRVLNSNPSKLKPSGTDIQHHLTIHRASELPCGFLLYRAPLNAMRGPTGEEAKGRGSDVITLLNMPELFGRHPLASLAPC
ncbi:hypothetical protein CC2G_009004 [Coprinopsis cinerea AmutBmut pab1-1]|nr:hypothetical protein CC2G_009004 [Coprinopsis cinerea AmutBmut pab1-1]